MKNTVLLAIFAMAAAGMMSGCNTCNGMIWDFANWDIEVTLTDAAGNNLLDPAFEGNILGNTITATTDGKVYTLNGGIEGATALRTAPATRATHANWGGFRTSQEHVALLGEFSTGSIDHQEVVIDWGDGSTSTLWFTLKVTGSNCNPTVNRILWLKSDAKPNGEVVNAQGLTVTIVK